jgi:hypothetical protein
MKKSLIILFIGAIFLGAGVSQSILADEFTGELKSPIEHETFGDLIDAIIKFAFNIALVLAPLFIVIGGFYFVAAAGDPSKIETGKKIIFYTLIGFLIILISRGLVVVLKDLIKVVE